MIPSPFRERRDLWSTYNPFGDNVTFFWHSSLTCVAFLGGRFHVLAFIIILEAFLGIGLDLSTFVSWNFMLLGFLER
jgi:hypothetical protein